MEAPAPPLRRPSSARLPGLDILRGIAALCVLHFHVMTIFFAGPGQAGLAPGKGYLAVDFFFMLSGYVMARTYEHRFAEGYGAARFMVGRYRRLWPVMAAGALLGAPMMAIEFGDARIWAPTVAANLLLVPVFTQNILYPVNSSAWSILAELAVNLLHVLVLRRLPTRWLVALACALLPLLAAGAAHYGSLDRGAGVDTLPIALLRALFAYNLGIVLWRKWRDVPPLRIPPAVTFLAMPALLLAGQALHVHAWYADVLFVVLCPLLVAGGLAWTRDGRTAFWLGAISFPLYAVNSPMLHWSYGLGLGALPGITCALALAACIALRTSSQARPIGSAASA